MRDLFLAVVPLLGVILGAYIQHIFASSKQKAEQPGLHRNEAYADYLRGVAALAGIVKLTDLGRISVTEAIMTLLRDPLYRRHRFPPEVIGYAVWLYFRFPLSLRMVEEMLAARGIEVSHETVRSWAEKFGREYSNRIRRRAPARGDKWHLDEVVITICGRKHWLWRAVDQNGFVLGGLVQSRRDRTAARRLMRAATLLERIGALCAAGRVIKTDGGYRLADR